MLLCAGTNESSLGLIPNDPEPDADNSHKSEQERAKDGEAAGTRRSALEWMKDSSRSERLERLNQQLPAVLKTKVRLGEVVASDASRDLAEARSECFLLVLSCNCLSTGYRQAGCRLAFGDAELLTRARCRPSQEGGARRANGAKVSCCQQRPVSRKLLLGASAQTQGRKKVEARRRFRLLKEVVGSASPAGTAGTKLLLIATEMTTVDIRTACRCSGIKTRQTRASRCPGDVRRIGSASV